MVMLRSSVLALGIIISIAAADPLREALSPSPPAAAGVQRAYFSLVSGKQTEAVAVYTDAIRRHPDSYLSYYRRGAILARLGQFEAALADFNSAVQLSPSVRTANDLGARAWNSLLPETHALNLVVLVRTARADLLRRMHRPADAIADLDVAIALDPRKTSLWHSRGLLHMEAGDAPSAIADFNALLARRESVDWRFARGISHFANGTLAEAEADFKKAVQIDPDNGLYARWLLKTQQRRGIPI